jgi:hypothetical protein
VGRSAHKISAIAKQAASTTDAAQRAALLAQMGPLKARMKTFGYIVFFLLLTAFVLMTLGHYV